MTQERIQTRYTLNGPLASRAELEQAITRAIEANKQDFFPLLERLVDVGDSRVKLSQKDPLRVLSIELADDREGLAHINYESNFAESCLIINEYDQHQTSLPFHLDGDVLVFDVELPIAWNFNN
ncbi:hypothetical protein UW989_08450 [Aeromonas caviae]|uniref:hypothetical protein n=1 Tax=Aeromonas TaxID=642 RepID=UPI0029D7CDBD|nr:hypothetical protein [Aeromonas caviae]MDX7836862.1 hypothetical protein [Aeromonas caviae]MDY7783810.1 hypothetical protein [Aeromonas caviae]